MESKRVVFGLRILAAVLLLLVVARIVVVQGMIGEKKQTLAVLDEQAAQVQQQNDAFRTRMSSTLSPEDIAEIARGDLGYIEPGERVFVDASAN